LGESPFCVAKKRATFAQAVTVCKDFGRVFIIDLSGIKRRGRGESFRTRTIWCKWCEGSDPQSIERNGSQRFSGCRGCRKYGSSLVGFLRCS
jgi:hypothetical protein